MTDSLSLEEIRQLEERLKAKQLRALPGRLDDKSKVVTWGHMASLSELVSLEEVRQVANKLKQRRVIWGLTQGQLGELICYKYGARLSQTTVSRFEMMDCTVATARRLFKPMKEMLELIDEIFEKNGSQHTDALCNLVKASIGEMLPTTKERKKRVTYTDEQLNALDALFKQCDSPSSAQLNRFAQTLGLSFPEVRVWFCNRRQKRRKTISPESLESGETEEEILARWEEKNKRKTVRSELQKQEAGLSMDDRASWASEETTIRRSEWTREAESEMKSRTLREKNKRIASIYEDEDIPYVPAEDEETVTHRLKDATKLRSKQIAEAFRQIRQCRNVELCFLVDATGSMQSHINEVRKQIQAIVSKLTDTDPHVSFAGKGGEAIAQNLKVAFVAYRDHGDSNQFEIFSFSRSIEDFKTFLSKIVATGGGDAPEDVFGGLENAINLNWSENAGCKVIFHICDAPCHGNTFHSGLGDSHAAGDPKGRTHTALFSKLCSQGIQYHFGKINDTTDIMIKKFSEAYGEPIIDFSVKDVEKIRESVITAVSVSVSASIAASKASSRRKERVYTYEKVEPDWSLCPVHKGKFLSYDFPDSIQSIIDDIPLEKRQTKSAEVQIAPNPFAKGAERVAFYGVDVSTYVDKPPPINLKNKTLRHRSTRGAAKSAVKQAVSPSDIKKKNEKIVLKEYLHKGIGMNSAKRYELSNHLQTVAAYMAKKFCEEVKKELKKDAIIKFTKIRTLLIPGETSRFMSCEILFGKDSKFIRFTNNATYEIMEEKAISLGVSTEFVQLVMAFSHWTYKVTKRFLMVVDLEGIISKIGTGENAILLTDPAIHCEDLTRYGKMNHGEKGMINFFSRHKCNSFCRSLGLESCKPDDF